MKPPPPLAYLAGHPLVMLLETIALGLMGWKLVEGATQAMPYVAAFAIMLAASGRAYRRVDTYRTWKREWDAMSPGEQPAPPSKPRFSWLVALAIAGGTLFMIGHEMPEARGLAILAGLAGALLLLVGWLLRQVVTARRGRRARTAALPQIVALAIDRPAMPPVPLSKAYAALPDYCYQVLSAPGRRP